MSLLLLWLPLGLRRLAVAESRTGDREGFVHPVSAMPPPGAVTEPYPPLPPDLQREQDERLAELRLARARAEVSSRDYLIV
jgi:hypothetical protein